MIGIILGLIIGAFLPLQTAVNSNLRLHIKSTYITATTAFIVGSIFLGIITLISGNSLLIPHSIISSQPWWIWFGGAFGIVGGTIPIVAFPRLGSVQNAIIPIFGQVIMGMLIDQFGWFKTAQRPITFTRIIGIIIVLIGLLLVIWQKNKNKQKTNVGNNLLWQLLVIIAGIALASQSAINGHLSGAVGSPIKASFISFFVSFIITLIGFIIFKPKDFTKLKNANQSGNHWWMWFAGIFGGLYVVGNSFLVPQIGTAATVVVCLLGNIICSLLIDQFGLIGAKKKSIILRQYIGLVIMIIGNGIINFL